jgi:methionyl-tRNA synthetase
LSPEQLIDPKSTLSGNPPVKRSTKHWYLPLNQHEAFLREWILEQHKDDWRPNVVGQCKGWIEAGLQPRAVTRDLDWGVQVPLEEAAGKVLYVWFDAPIGYISATRQWALDNGKEWEPYWYNEDTKLVHFIGKDNIVFHCIIFPAMLKLHGNILPDNVPSNEFMNLEGDKMSTSRGWSIEMYEYIQDFVRKENGGEMMVDALRYYLTQIAPETKDSEFTWKGFQDAVNNELVAVFGNFVNRTFVLMHKLCAGKVPPLHADILDDQDRAMLQEITDAPQRIQTLLEAYKFRDALFEVVDLARKGNQYMQRKEPWIVARTVGENGQPTADAQKSIDNSLHICLQLCANLAIVANPILPFTARKMCAMMKVVDKMLDWENAGKIKLLSVGYNLRAPELLFRKIDDAEVAEQVEKLKAKAAALKMNEVTTAETVTPEAVTPVLKPEIVFDDFGKIDLKVGTIVSAEKVEKADKLLQLQVDLGFEVRTIVSGIALHFEPAAIVGKQVVVVANLAPRKMRGIMSNGMILMAEDAIGKLHFVSPEAVINAGSNVS